MNNHVIQAGKAASRPLVLNKIVVWSYNFLKDIKIYSVHDFSEEQSDISLGMLLNLNMFNIKGIYLISLKQ